MGVDRSLVQPRESAGPAEHQLEHAVHRALNDRWRSHLAALDRLAECSSAVADCAGTLVETLRAGNKVLLAGNGGSAAEAQHFATELVGRFKREREAYPVIALTADSSVLTAIANDYGYDDVFARQVEAYGCPGDLLILVSTSGESENVVRAAAAARSRQVGVVAVTGEGSSRLGRLADIVVRAPSRDTPTVQECHMIVTHVLCDVAETVLSGAAEGAVR